MEEDYEKRLVQIIRMQDWITDALVAVRDLRLPDWYIAAGAVRNTVWNYLHDFPTTAHQKDVDVIYFDVNDLKGMRESDSENMLKKKILSLNWEVVNQARAHLFDHASTKRPSVKSSSESIAYWSETPTCVGIRLELDDSLTVCAPHGLADLMNLIVRPIPQPYQSRPLYEKRISEKNWSKQWPKLRIL